MFIVFDINTFKIWLILHKIKYNPSFQLNKKYNILQINWILKQFQQIKLYKGHDMK